MLHKSYFDFEQLFPIFSASISPIAYVKCMSCTEQWFSNPIENKESLWECSFLGPHFQSSLFTRLDHTLLTSIWAHIGLPSPECKTASARPILSLCTILILQSLLSTQKKKSFQKFFSNLHVLSFFPLATDSYTTTYKYILFLFFILKLSLWISFLPVFIKHFFQFLYYGSAVIPDSSPQTIIILFFYLEEN